jgi:signal transduction histidine kinase
LSDRSDKLNIEKSNEQIELLGILMEQGKFAIISLLIVPFLFAYVLITDSNQTNIITWCLSLSLVNVIRGIYLKIKFKDLASAPSRENAKTFEWAFGGLAFLSGLYWSGGIIYFFPLENPLLQAFSFFIVAGMVSGCANAYASSKIAPASFIFSITIPIVLYTFTLGNSANITMGVLTGLYSILLYGVSSQNHVQLKNQILLRVKTEKLIEKLNVTNNELHESHEQLQSSHSALIERARMAVVGDMASGIAHEINNPLAIIKGYVQMIRIQLAKTSKIENSDKILSKIESAVARASHIVSSLITLSGEETSVEHENTDFEPVCIALDLLEHLTQNNLADQNVECTFNVSDRREFLEKQIPSVLTQAFTILIRNSIESLQPGSEGFIEINLEEGADELLIISIVDSGIGIPEENVPNIFDAFFTTKQFAKNPGMGLSVASSIVARCGGKLIYCPEKPNTHFQIEITAKIKAGPSTKSLSA